MDLDLSTIKAHLNTLSEDEKATTIAALAKLGITIPDKHAAIKAAKRLLPPEYDLSVHTYCMTCEDTEITYFHMTQDESRWALVSVPLVQMPAGRFKVRKETRRTCKYCESNLKNWKKEELVAKILSITAEKLKY